MTKVFLTNQEAAAYCGFSPRTFDAYRIRGSGPAFVKRGKRVLYALDDLNAWIGTARFNSTADYRPVVA